MPGPGRHVWKRFTTTHCDLHARMGIAYDPTEPVKLELPVYDREGYPTGQFVKIDHPGEKPHGEESTRAAVCAVDDAVGLWPRYEHLMSDNSYEVN